MKKVLLTLTLAAFAFAANAQFVLGGYATYYHEGGNMKYTGVAGSSKDAATPYNSNAVTYSYYSIMPKIGYQLNDKMQAGISFGITGGVTKDFSMFRVDYWTYPEFEGWVKTSYSGFEVAPYFRYNLGTIKGVTFFCEAQLSFYFGGKDKIHRFNTAIDDSENFYTRRAIDTTYTGNYKTNSITFSVVPGINYKFNDRLSADLYIDLLKLTFDHTTTIQENYDYDGDKLVETENTFYVGARLNAQTLTDQFSHFRLGFNYHF